MHIIESAISEEPSNQHESVLNIMLKYDPNVQLYVQLIHNSAACSCQFSELYFSSPEVFPRSLHSCSIHSSVTLGWWSPLHDIASNEVVTIS